MSSPGVMQLNDRQENLALSTTPSDMLELTDEDLAQVAGADGGMYDGGMSMERMGHMYGYCARRYGRRMSLRLTHLHVEYRMDFLSYNMRVN